MSRPHSSATTGQGDDGRVHAQRVAEPKTLLADLRNMQKETPR